MNGKGRNIYYAQLLYNQEQLKFKGLFCTYSTLNGANDFSESTYNTRW